MRYFDKDFFKFTFGFLLIIAISLLIMLWISGYISNGDDQSAKLFLAG